MTNLMKLEFAALDITGKNYLSWMLDAEIHLDAKGLGNTIMKENEASKQDKANAMIFLRHHLDEGILNYKDPLELWSNLKERYDHKKTVIFPKARYNWMHLRSQDFKSHQYREKCFKKYSELISCLLVAEQNNELLMRNHEIRSTESAPFPKVNATLYNNFNRGNKHGRSHERGCGRGLGRNNYRFQNNDFNDLSDITHLDTGDFLE
ncbi:hypothetical protein CDL12_00351 [Handroanthus impetiginosus]|uniref:Uncharacterized protein n=1 Tax=Handroanthus impetiginosus TaxID=429701 RepID=A0A2G9IAX0_9LAMI|nr:hypothetical protein CDL12_00351 [Handroanthus impetiginosus]